MILTMRKFLFPIFISLLLLSGCSSKEAERTASVFAMDTIMDITIYSADDKPLTDAQAELRRIDSLLDRGNGSGEIYAVNTYGCAEVSDETSELLCSAVSVSGRTGGLFDITTAPISDLWGFYGGNFRVPSDDEITAALETVGYEKIEINKNTVSVRAGTQLDLGGIAKGYASDRVADILKKDGVKSAVISLGGNVYALGSKPDGSPWRIGITDPADKNALIGTVNVRDRAVVTSGAYQRYFESDGVRYHHIIDPRTGRSAESGLASVTIISDSGTTADALSTAFFIAGLDNAAELCRKWESVEAVFVTDSGKIYVTEGISESFSSDRHVNVLK